MMNYLPLFLNKPLAFMWRDFLEDKSYKLAFITQLLSIFISTAMFYFLSRLLGTVGASYLQPYGGDYFSFVLIGIAFYSYLGVSMGSLADTIREGQQIGTLEALLVTQTEIPTIIVSSSLYSLFWATLKVALYLAVGVCFFGVNLGEANIPGALIILILTILSFGSLGIVSASFVMVLKRGDPVNWIVTSVSGLLGGLYYPVSVLPDWLQTVSYLLPVTYALDGMRYAVLQGHNLTQLLPHIFPLMVFSVIMLPLSILIFGYAVRKAKKDGTLTQY